MFDIRTLAVVTVIFSFVYGVGLLVYSSKQSHFKGLSIYGFGDLLAGVSFLLMCMRGFLSDIASVISANMFTQLALFFMLLGITRFLKVKSKMVHLSIVISVILLFSLIYYTSYKPDVGMRIVIMSVTLALQCIFIGALILRNKDKEVSILYNFMSLSFLFSAVFMLVRAVWTYNYEQLSSFMNAGMIHAFSFLFFIYLMISSNMLLVFITSKKLELELEKQALTDPLTGLFNRRALNADLNKEIAKSIRNKKTFGVILADIDRFKVINDEYGHEFGDEVLKEFSRILTDSVRLGDIVARIGGEEFVILLSELDEKETYILAERIRKNVESLDIMHEGKKVNITSSFGITVFKKDEDDNEVTILSRADKAMYISKEEGRNCSTIYT